MRKYVLAFVAVALYSWIVAILGDTETVVATKAVTPENIRAARMDEGTFRGRWASVVDMPPTREVIDNTVLLVSHEAPLRAVAAASVRPPLRAHGVSLQRHDICARHHMRRVVTRGGRSWRCRR